MRETAAADPTPEVADREVAGYEVVLVAYRSRSLVEGLLATLPDTVPVVVIDNAHGVDGLVGRAA